MLWNPLRRRFASRTLASLTDVPHVILTLFACSITPVISAQQPRVEMVAGRTVADVGHYFNGDAVSSSNGERVAASAGLSVRWRPTRRVSLTSNVSLLGRGEISGSYWLNATYLDIGPAIDVAIRRPSSRIQPYVGAGIAAGVLLDCARGETTISGPYRDECGNGGPFMPAVSRWDTSAEFRIGLRARTPSRAVALELARSTSLRSFDRTWRDSRHRMWAVRARVCIARCR